MQLRFWLILRMEFGESVSLIVDDKSTTLPRYSLEKLISIVRAYPTRGYRYAKDDGTDR